jgi:hypothetical protein
MILISHRGNIGGKIPEKENHPIYIDESLNLGYNFEVDVWYVDDKLMLGHDNPQYEVLFSFFKENMWIHSKNLQACEQLLKTNLNWFWHENDKITLTSKGYIWSYPNIYVDNGITVEFGYNKDLPKHILGICTDYPELYNE